MPVAVISGVVKSPKDKSVWEQQPLALVLVILVDHWLVNLAIDGCWQVSRPMVQ